MHRVVACLGSPALEAQCPEVESDDAAAGTLGHAYLAGEAVALDDKMQETVDTCERLTLEIADAHGFAHITPVKEQRLWWTEDGVKKFSGQFDRAYIDRENGRAIVFDYKLLHGDHDEAAQNWQLRTLALLTANSYDACHVIVVLVQPWKKGQFTIAEYGPAELIEARTAILAAVEASQQPNAPRTPGDHCKFCKALAICPEAQKKTETSIERLTFVRTMDSYTPLERGQMLDWITQAEGVLDARKKELKAFEVANPGSISGWKMKPGNEVREITNKSGLYFALKSATGCTMDVFMDACKVSLKPLQAIHKSATGTKGKAAEDAFDALVKPFTTTRQNAASLERVK